MDDGIGVILFFNLVIGSIVGALIGNAARNQAVSGLVWGALLGPIGWIIVLCLDDLRKKCPLCGGVVVENAMRCKNCGGEIIGNLKISRGGWGAKKSLNSAELWPEPSKTELERLA